MYLEELIENIQLESDKFECKSLLNREDVVGWLKTIAGFANVGGGDFYAVQNGTIYDAEFLGVSDSTYFRKQVLGNLVEQGYLETSKIARAMYYKTNFDMVQVN